MERSKDHSMKPKLGTTSMYTVHCFVVFVEITFLQLGAKLYDIGGLLQMFSTVLILVKTS